MSFLVRAIRKIATSGEASRALFPGGTSSILDCDSASQQDVAALAVKFADRLCQISIRGACVIIAMPHGADFVSALLACFCSDVTAVPAVLNDGLLTPEQAKAIWAQHRRFRSAGHDCVVLGNASAAPVLVSHSDATPSDLLTFEALIEGDSMMLHERRVAETSIAVLLMTSGSEGRPKGVPLSHRNIWHQIRTGRAHWCMNASSRPVTWLSPNHNFGLLFGVLVPFITAASCRVISTQDFAKQPVRWFHAMAYHKATHLATPNFAFDLCCDSIGTADVPPQAFSNVSHVICGGEPVQRAAAIRFFDRYVSLGAQLSALQPHYGMSECGSISTAPVGIEQFVALDPADLAANQASQPSDQESKTWFANCGTVSSDTRVIIWDSDCAAPCRDGHIGEILVASDGLIANYWFTDANDPAPFLVLPDESDRFFRTGDLGFLTDGKLVITGRTKDVIIQRGKNHYPAAIEATALAAAQGRIATCAVFTSSDRVHDDVILAFGLGKAQDCPNLQPPDMSELARRARKAISKTHGLHLSNVIIVDQEAFGSSTSKLKRGPIKEAYSKGTLPVLWSDVPKAVDENSIKKITHLDAIISTLRDQVFTPTLGNTAQGLSYDTDFGEFGLNSLQCARIAGLIEVTFGQDFNPSHLYTYTTLRKVANSLLSEQVSSKRTTMPTSTLESRAALDVGSDPIAIIGMHCEIPGAGVGTDAFWDFLSKGGDGVGTIAELRPDLWRSLSRYAKIPAERVPRHAGLLSNVDQFDADFFGISRREAECMDPQQRKVLQFIWDLGEVSNLRPSAWDGHPVGLYVGAHSRDYADLLATRPDVMASSGAYIDSGTHLTMIANRASRWFNFKGPSEVINTACSSSLVALHRAVGALRTGECTSALVLGVNLISAPVAFLSSALAGMLSASGACRTLDANADGFVRSEALAGVVLKPLSAAIADEDYIHGVIRASGVNHDGRSNSLRAPNGASQRDLLLSIYGQAGIDPSSVSYVELHGTGTVLGDPIEVRALSEAFYELNSAVSIGTCVLGSVKANVGHTESAAGLVGLIKVLLCMRHKELVRMPHFMSLNSNIQLEKTPFRVLSDNESWTPSRTTKLSPLRAGISSFGFGGVNAHVIIESYNASSHELSEGHMTTARSHIFIFSAKSDAQLTDRAQQILSWLDSNECDMRILADLARTLQLGREELDFRLGVIATTVDDLKKGLLGYLGGVTHTRSLSVGRKAQNPSAFEALESDTAFSQAVNSWISNRSLTPLLELWVHGVSVNWSAFWPGIQSPMLSLPPYPFAQQFYRLPEESSTNARSHPPQYTSHQDEVDQRTSATAFSTDILVELGNILKTDVSAIDIELPFSEIGLDSVGIMSFAGQLNERFDWNISPTVFYQYTTVHHLLAYLQQTYALPSTEDRGAPDRHSTTASQSILATPQRPTNFGRTSEIAIIGISGSFPNSPDIPSYWDNLASGRDCISEIPDTRWGSVTEEEIRFAGIMDDIANFDPRFFGISPREAMSMDPQHRLLLTHSWQALEDAGYAPRSLAGTDTAVIVGAERSGYSELLIKAGQPIESFSAIGMVASMGPNRVSHLLDLHGPSEPVETACSSSLVAIHRAVELLRRGSCRMAIAGGVNTIVSRELHAGFGKAGMLSTDGRCRTFSATADGYVRGEGVGILVLKPLDQAEQDGDQIYGTILGTAINHGGKSASLTAPNPRAQAKLIREAIVDANVDPKTISYIEMHGTGTPLGDPIEFQGLTMAIGQDNDTGSCGIGSVKSNIGHLELAAGVAGLIKILLQMKYRTLVPSLHSTPLNPEIPIKDSPFYVVQKKQSWIPSSNSAGRLRAGVSSFGAGGVNAHVILQDYPQTDDRLPASSDLVLIVLSARTRDQLTKQAHLLLSWLEQNPQTNMKSLAYTLQVGRDAMGWRLAMIATTLESLHTQLSQFVAQGTTTSQGFLSSKECTLIGISSLTPKDPHISPKNHFDSDYLATLARNWINGASVEWKTLYHDQLRKLHLPTYPFAKQAFWPTFPPISNRPELLALDEAVHGDLMLKARHWHACETPETTTDAMQIDRRVIAIGLSDASHEAIAATGDAIAIKRDSEDTPTFFARSIIALTEVVQTQYAQRRPQPVLIQIVVPTTGEDGLFAAVSGWLEALRSERPDLDGQLIAVDDQDPQTLPILLSRNASTRHDKFVRYRDRTRYIPTWRNLPTDIPSTNVWATNGTYMITGGLGGLGRCIAHDIRSKAPSANIVLLGRSTLTFEDHAFLKALRDVGIGDVRYESIDIVDSAAVGHLVTQIINSYGKLSGVIHTAGVIQDSFIHNKNPETIQAVLAAKVTGTHNLDAATKLIALDIFICFSSLVAVIGNQGQSDYAAANAFLDQFAEYRNSLVGAGKRYGRTVSINWPIWDGGGMHIDASTRRRIFERTGLVPLPTSIGVEAFHAAVASLCTQVLVAYGDLARFSKLFVAGNVEEVKTELPHSVLDPAAVQEAQTFLIKTIAHGLNIPVADIDLDTGLDTYGLDSLMVMQLTDDLEGLLGPLPKTLFFEHSTLRTLIAYITDICAAPLRKYLYSGSSAHLAVVKATITKHQANVPNISPSAASDVAIIGLAGTYPGARTLEEFWSNLRTGKDCITEIPSDRWDHSQFFDPDRRAAGKTYSKWGGFIDGYDEFDPLLFNISPQVACLMDPQERLFLQCVYSAVEDAGYTPQTLDSHHSVAVFAGAMYTEYQLYGVHEQIAGNAVALNSLLASIANRVSYCFDFRGPSMSVDTMCSSSLAAIHLACQSLRRGDCGVAIAGGVSLSLHPNKYIGLAQGNFLSSTGRCQSFGRNGDGYVPAEGVGAVILKPLDRAIRDKDSIYGVIRGSALNNGGKTNGYSVPNPNAQADVIRAAIKDARVDPATITYVEAHGTGTELGDPIEISGLTKAFGLDKSNDFTCAIGSVKSNIGHCEAAAGIAALTKVLLQLRAGEIAPSLHADELNEHIDFDSTPFRVQTHLAPWRNPYDCPRRAGVSSFGAGGTNVHIIVEEFRGSPLTETNDTRAEAIVLSARTPQALADRIKDLRDFLLKSDVSLARIAYSLHSGRNAMAFRIACIATSRDDLQVKLAKVLSGSANISDVFEGDIRSSRSELSRLMTDDFQQETLKRQFAERDFAAPLAAWVKGFDIEFLKLRSDPVPQRAHLPSYPFARERYWVPAKQPLSSAENSNHIEPAPTDIDKRAHGDPILAAVLDQISITLGIVVDLIDPDASFSDYGIDSVHAISLSAVLSEIFDIDLGPTVPFDFDTATSLAEHIRSLHGGMLGRKSIAKAVNDDEVRGTLRLGLRQIKLPGEAGCPVALFYPTHENSRRHEMGAYTLDVAVNAEPLANLRGLILMSHGFGGTGFAHHQLARHLAMSRYLVAAPHHTTDRLRPGHSRMEGRDFLTRTSQLRKTLDFLLTNSDWAEALSGGPIGAVGHSGGGAAVLALLGARLTDTGSALTEPTGDPRVSAAVLMAPMAISFCENSLSSITTPLWILTAQNDEYRGDPRSEEFYVMHLPNARHDDVHMAGHFSFMSLPDTLRQTETAYDMPLRDPDGFDRRMFETSHHAGITAFFDQCLKRPKQQLERPAAYVPPIITKKIPPRAVLFPGQGTQFVGMGQGMFDEDPQFVANENAINEFLGFSVRDVCLNGPQELLNQTQYTQPCVYVVNALHYAAYLKSNPAPLCTAGHSLGEYNALLAAGVFDFFTGLKLVKSRAEYMSSAKDGAMAAVIGLIPEQVSEHLANHHPMIDVANSNAPLQTVISGPLYEIRRAKDSFSGVGAKHYVILPVSAAFHSRYMKSASLEFAQYLANVPIKPPAITVISNLRAEPYPTIADDIRTTLSEQIWHPVQWTKTIQWLLDNEADPMTEIGRSDTLTRLSKQIREHD
ncbi:ACP S-malonyltransferase [Rhizobium rhizogenes]|uniref:type I polyketide synthase n=1 Tax=Rhizobium rhizogenes TaxID=359 RepID=UPI001574D74E|nr:type I polyketide synthase [Rhizobium rhizogenes]NTI24867.1 ACP S-malonyltransferase [Rhizobium rhizogenes]QTG08587.1 ACP S-malonyltransferase [Rhizobium rhizogenes]